MKMSPLTSRFAPDWFSRRNLHRSDRPSARIPTTLDAASTRSHDTDTLVDRHPLTALALVLCGSTLAGTAWTALMLSWLHQ